MSNLKEYPLKYSLDSLLNVKDQQTIYTSEGFYLSISDLQKEPVDVKSTYNTNLILTKKDIISNSFEDINKKFRDQLDLPDQFVTYIGIVPGGAPTANDPQAFLATEYISTDTRDACDGVPLTIDATVPGVKYLTNKHFFEISLEPGLPGFARISHYNTREILYLTYNHNTNSIYLDNKGAPTLGTKAGDQCFSFSTFTDPREDPQLFEYLIDDTTGYLRLMKFGHDPNDNSASRSKGVFLVTGDLNTSPIEMTLHDIPPGSQIESLPAFKIELPIDIKTNDMTSSVVTYSNNKLIVKERVNDTKHNLLVHDEFRTGQEGDINIISLKNQLPNTFEHTKNNLIPGSNKVDYRDYTAITTDDLITVADTAPGVVYNDHTAEIKLVADKLTYFHLPAEIYPYNKLYINDSGLKESGAISGSIPATSDKIFKKSANYQESLHYGNPDVDQTGQWACAWLYTPTGKPEDAIWVDRYFDPKTYSWTQALTSTTTTIYEDTLDLKKDYQSRLKQSIFDVQSTLMLEPSAYYAYHHIGGDNISSELDKLYGDRLIIDEFRELDLSSRSSYTISDKIDDYTGFNVSFTLSKRDDIEWSDKIGYHILGNYINEGFSIFNDITYTPVVYAVSHDNKSVDVYDTSLSHIISLSLEVPDPTNVNVRLSTEIVDFTIFETLGNIYCIRKEKSSPERVFLYEYDMSGTVIEITEITSHLSESDIITFSEDYIVIYDTSNFNVRYLNLLTEDVTDLVDVDHPVYFDEMTNKVYRPGDIYIKKDIYVQKVERTENGQVITRSIFTLNPKQTDGTSRIKEVYESPKGDTYIIFKDSCDGIVSDFIISFNVRGEYKYVIDLNQISSISGNIDIESEYNIFSTPIIIDNKESEHIHIARNNDNHTVTYVINSLDGSLVSEITRDLTFKDIRSFQAKESNTNILRFKHKLHNVIDRDDIKTVVVDLDMVKEFTGSSHHICYDFDPDTGVSSIYIDGILHKQIPLQSSEKGGKYSFTEFRKNKFRVGDVPFLHGTSFADSISEENTSINTNYNITDLKMYNSTLPLYVIRNIASSSSEIDDIIWTIPYTKRHFVDGISKVQKHSLPGIKSNKLSSCIHSDIPIHKDLKNDVLDEINRQIIDFIPGNVEYLDPAGTCWTGPVTETIPDEVCCALIPDAPGEECRSVCVQVHGLHTDIDGSYIEKGTSNNRPVYRCGPCPDSQPDCDIICIDVDGVHSDIDGMYTITGESNSRDVYTAGECINTGNQPENN